MTTACAAVVSLRTVGAEQTEAVGAALAAIVAPGVVVGLAGPLGAGKTCFVRGMAAQLGVDPGLVASPTFVYLVDYPGDGVILFHADLYRLADVPDESSESVYEGIGLAAAFAAGGIAVVEWWDSYRGPPPAALVRVEFVIETVEHRHLTVVFEGSKAGARAAAFSSKLIAAGLTTQG